MSPLDVLLLRNYLAGTVGHTQVYMETEKIFKITPYCIYIEFNFAPSYVYERVGKKEDDNLKSVFISTLIT